MNRLRGAVLNGFAIAGGLLALTLVLTVLGYDAGTALGALGRSAAGSWYAFTSATLVRSIPLIVIGLGIAVAFRGGALNVGGEGQFYAGAIAATATALSLGGAPPLLAIPLTLLAGSIGGALWVAVPVLLKLRFGVLEVITTLLLNFVAEAGVSYAVQGPLQESKGIYPQSDQIAASARLPLLPGTRLHLGFALATLVAITTWVVFRRTRWGFQLRAAGESARAAWITGRISVHRLLAHALFTSGALAGLAGAIEVTGVTYALYQNLSPGYGFSAIAVALLARLDPLAVIAAGIGFGALEAGAGGMQREAGVPAVAAYVVQAVIIVVVLLGLSRSRLARAEASA